MSRIQFIDIPKSNHPLDKILEERMIDWHENSSLLLRKMTEHREKYRKKICTGCIDTQQQKDRNCIGMVIDGRKIFSCSHMDLAVCSKFKKEFDAHMNFHPAIPH